MGLSLSSFFPARRITSAVLDAFTIYRTGLFDTKRYAESSKIRLQLLPFAILHYVFRGGDQGFDAVQLFDSRWYCEHYPDARLSPLSPLSHYLRHGAAQGYAAGPHFDTRWYENQYPDVALSNLNPLEHYLRFGHLEGRSISPTAQEAGFPAPSSTPKPRSQLDYLNLARRLRHSGELDLAREHADTGLSIFPRDAALIAESAEIFMETHNWRAAANAWAEITTDAQSPADDKSIVARWIGKLSPRRPPARRDILAYRKRRLSICLAMLEDSEGYLNALGLGKKQAVPIAPGAGAPMDVERVYAPFLVNRRKTKAYRFLSLGERGYFEKIYLNKTEKADHTRQFYKLFYPSLRDHLPAIHYILQGEDFSALYFEQVRKAEGASDMPHALRKVLKLVSTLNSVQIPSDALNIENAWLENNRNYQNRRQQAPRNLAKLRSLVPEERRSQIDVFVDSLNEAEKFIDLQIPRCLSHGDMHLGNIAIRGEDIFLLDTDEWGFLALGADIGRLLLSIPSLGPQPEDFPQLVADYHNTHHPHTSLSDFSLSIWYHGVIMNAPDIVRNPTPRKLSAEQILYCIEAFNELWKQRFGYTLPKQ